MANCRSNINEPKTLDTILKIYVIMEPWEKEENIYSRAKI